MNGSATALPDLDFENDFESARPRGSWRLRRSSDVANIDVEELLMDALPDSGEYIDQDTSAETLAVQNRKAQLLAIISEYLGGAPAWDGGDAIAVSPGAVQTARRFISALPENRALPRVAPDGEGDVLLVWPPDQGDCIVTVEPAHVHLVTNATTRASRHVDAVPFNGERIPFELLRYLPLR
jgi:hypothetical protein